MGMYHFINPEEGSTSYLRLKEDISHILLSVPNIRQISPNCLDKIWTDDQLVATDVLTPKRWWL